MNRKNLCVQKKWWTWVYLKDRKSHNKQSNSNRTQLVLHRLEPLFLCRCRFPPPTVPYSFPTIVFLREVSGFLSYARALFAIVLCESFWVNIIVGELSGEVYRTIHLFISVDSPTWSKIRALNERNCWKSEGDGVNKNCKKCRDRTKSKCKA